MPTLLLGMMILLCAVFGSVCGQEMSAFELMANHSVGLTEAPSAKWGVAIADIDRNGWPDIYQARSAAPGYSRIYLNKAGVFQDITAQSPLQRIESGTTETETKTAAWIDFDNDGDKDLYFGTSKKMHLLRNDNSTFVDIAASIGLVGGKQGFVSEYEYANGAWGDFDRDGDLDVLVAQHNNSKPYFYRNDHGVFVDIQPEMGLVLDIGYNSYGVQWIDFDLDGDLDLSARAWLFRNDEGRFTEVSQSLGLKASQPQNVAWFDYDNDGDLDYFHSVSASSGPEFNELWENQAGRFVNVSNKVFLLPMQFAYRGLSVGDFDNDGDLDLFLNRNSNVYDVLLLNEEVEPGVRVFQDVAEFVGITKIGDRKCGSFFDYNRDGFLDLYITSAEFNHLLYRNVGNTGHWIGFILEGTQSNRDAIGTLVKVYAGGKSQIRFTQAPTDYQNQDNPYVHFGLGTNSTVDSVVIRWPLGMKQVLTNLTINQYHEIKEAQSSPVSPSTAQSREPGEWRLRQNFPNPFNASTLIAYELPRTAAIKVKIFDQSGRWVATLIDGTQAAGLHQMVWKGTDHAGQAVPSGEYFCRIEADSFIDIVKMVLLK